jgi:hypothetical protein
MSVFHEGKAHCKRRGQIDAQLSTKLRQEAFPVSTFEEQQSEQLNTLGSGTSPTFQDKREWRMQIEFPHT